MGSITFSGFNKIDFNMILNAVMEQERAPLVALQKQRTALESQREAFATLATRLGALDAAATGLADASSFGTRTCTVSDTGAVKATAGSSTPEGTYEIVVNSLARGQVTTTGSTWSDKDATIVASGGTLTIGAATISINGDTTLQGLADAINSAADVPATATIVCASGQYRLVLTGRATGAQNAFAVTPGLTGGTGVSFSASNAVEAQDADVLVNNVRVTSSSNSVEGAVPGATLTLLEETASPVTVSVGRDVSSIETAVQSFITAYNDLVQFFDAQVASAAEGRASSIARDPVTRSLRAALREGLTRRLQAEGTLQYLSQIGIRFDRTGKLSLDKAVFDTAARDIGGLQAFVAGTGSSGAFDAIRSVIGAYVRGDGLVPGARSRLSAEMQRLDTRMMDMEARLAIRQQALQREYAAADAAMTQLNSQMSSLSSIGSQYQLF